MIFMSRPNRASPVAALPSIALLIPWPLLISPVANVESLVVGYAAGSNEKYTIGEDVWDFDPIWAGVYGNGTVIISGGTVTTNEIDMGYDAFANGTLVIGESAVVS